MKKIEPVKKLKRITSAVVDPSPASIFAPLPAVTATFDDGSTEKLFTFYPDEISFSAEEFVGKTRVEAHRLKQQKDAAFLRA
jgi:hypothetical protein